MQQNRNDRAIGSAERNDDASSDGNCLGSFDASIPCSVVRKRAVTEASAQRRPAHQQVDSSGLANGMR